MIKKAPPQFNSSEDVDLYAELLKNRLLLPEQKFRVALPLIGVLFFEVYAQEPTLSHKILGAVNFFEANYKDELSSRDYRWWEKPYSNLVHFEYGLIENLSFEATPFSI
jgi:hypothetical protein